VARSRRDRSNGKPGPGISGGLSSTSLPGEACRARSRDVTDFSRACPSANAEQTCLAQFATTLTARSRRDRSNGKPGPGISGGLSSTSLPGEACRTRSRDVTNFLGPVRPPTLSKCASHNLLRLLDSYFIVSRKLF
jgi:hypothetical protein